ncbi:DEAD/DEAH box helicase [Leptolyngbya sp. O-77]|uniref:DEAD/DEAH box helicase n=1 Tax=Leptolyngbya sp. O-77 TaxID=1080068 RepID=UPI00074D30B5|nr:DEAD/DEAH box helicase family protein [Leptolyngbya sp. O-77]BAU41259.1 UvrABC system protein B [Leptolyngbya sp. O-77]
MTAQNATAPTPPTLRPYQVQLIKDLYNKLGEGYKRVAVIAGTGAGKTVIAGQICAHAEARGCRLLFLVHLDVLVGQTYDKMRAFGLHCGFIKAGWKEDPTAPIQIASVQTMTKRHWWKKWHADVVLFDEAHTTVFSQVGQQVLYKTHPNAVHLALTATPYRLGKSQLGDHMETLVASPVPSVLQKMGYLAPMKYYGLSAEHQIDLSGVGTVAGDYDERALKNACDRPELVERIVEEWLRLVPDKRTIAFCVDVEHARHVADAFNQANVPAATVDGETPIKDRQKLYADLRDGHILVLTSCNVISIGFDEPSVEVGLLLRPTSVAGAAPPADWARHANCAAYGQAARHDSRPGGQFGAAGLSRRHPVLSPAYKRRPRRHRHRQRPDKAVPRLRADCADFFDDLPRLQARMARRKPGMSG